MKSILLLLLSFALFGAVFGNPSSDCQTSYPILSVGYFTTALGADGSASASSGVLFYDETEQVRTSSSHPLLF
jgi:hypothetical protein